MKTTNTLVKISLVFWAILMPFNASSQNATRRQMDIIKHDNKFLSSKETYSESESEAIREALKKINYVVKKYIRDSTNLTIDVNQVGLEQNGERLVFNEDGVYYVLIYIPKSMILDLGGSPTSSQETPVEELPEIASHPTETQLDAEIPQPVQIESSLRWETDLAEWQRTVIEELLACEQLNAVVSKLQQMKDSFKVKRWGAAKDCLDAAKAYWVVFDDEQRVATILGPGSDKRMNYRTAQFSSLSDYKNMNAIWFYMAK